MNAFYMVTKRHAFFSMRIRWTPEPSNFSVCVCVLKHVNGKPRKWKEKLGKAKAHENTEPRSTIYIQVWNNNTGERNVRERKNGKGKEKSIKQWSKLMELMWGQKNERRKKAVKIVLSQFTQPLARLRWEMCVSGKTISLFHTF